MTELTTLNPKVSLTPLGLDVHEQLTLDDWRDIGVRIGTAMRSIAFVVGDWLVYGEGRDGQRTLWPEIPEQDKVPDWLFEEASRLTGMDMTTLGNYAFVARSVPRSLRNRRLSWEHHRKVARLKDDSAKIHWLNLAAQTARNGRVISARRFARSIEFGRILTKTEMAGLDGERGIETVHPWVNRIVSFIARLRRVGWFDGAHSEKRAALKRDLEPVVNLYNEL